MHDFNALADLVDHGVFSEESLTAMPGKVAFRITLASSSCAGLPKARTKQTTTALQPSATSLAPAVRAPPPSLRAASFAMPSAVMRPVIPMRRRRPP
jgi:hypothetical protein